MPADMPLPGSADPGRALENQRPLLPQENALEPEAPKKQAIAVAPAGTENLKFILHDLAVQDMTAYKPEDIAGIYQRYVGQEISVATLFEIMGAVQQKYLDDGYALTKVVIPNQNIQGGHVQLAVIEGHVGEVQVTGNLSQSYVLDDAARRIRAMHPLNVKKLERIMLIVNDLPDLNVSAVLAKTTRPEEHDAGAVRLILEENPDGGEEKRGSVTIDDYGSVFTGPLEARANARLFHVGPRYSELSLTGLATAPIEEQKLGALSYSVPVFGASGTTLTLNMSRASTEPGSSLSTLDIKGSSQTADAQISYPVIRQRDQTLKIDAGFEWKNARTKILGEELYDDRLRTAKVGLSYNFIDNWAGYNLADIHFSKGLDIFGVRETGSVDLSRQDGRSDFTKVEMLAGRLQALPWNFEVFGLVTGQYANVPLLSSEEFGFGGGQIGRGYDASEITGDRGVAASVELRHRTSVPVMKTTLAIQPYIFYDAGMVWNIDRDAKDRMTAVSAGAGVRFDLGNEWSADVNLAKPLTRSADNEPKYQNDVGARVLFSITHNF